MIIGPGEPPRREKAPKPERSPKSERAAKAVKKAKAKKGRRPDGSANPAKPGTAGDPALDVAVADAPVADAPVVDAPVADAPVADAPVADGTVVDAPVTDARAVDATQDPAPSGGPATTQGPALSDAAPRDTHVPLADVAGSAGADVPLIARIDVLRGRVDILLALVDGTTKGPSPDASPTRTPDVRDPVAPPASAATTDAVVVPADPTDPAAEADPPAGLGRPVVPPRAASVGRASDRGARPDAVPSASEAQATRPPAAASAAPRAAPSSAVLVARELLAGGMPADGVRSRLRDAYGVTDPDAVLAGVGR